MKPSRSKTQAQAAIDTFFQRASWAPDELRKIKRLAMKHRLKLGAYRRRFCKSCLSPLRGTTRVTKTHTTIVCGSCGAVNRHQLWIPECFERTIR